MQSQEFSGLKSQSVSFEEYNPLSTDASDNYESNGLFIVPSNNVPGRPSDITGYCLISDGPEGKVVWGDLTDFLSLESLKDVEITNPQTNQVLSYNGTDWINSTINLGGIGSLNGLNATIQTLVTGTNGTDFTIVSNTSSHTFNLPDSSASSRGLLNAADWNTFNNKLTNSLPQGNIFIGNASNVPNPVTVFGDATISPTGQLILENTAVSPGSYTNSNVIVDSKGRIITISNGTAPSTPGGNDTNIQFNNAGSFGGNDSFTYSSNLITSRNNDLFFENNPLASDIDSTSRRITGAEDAANPVAGALLIQGGNSTNDTGPRVDGGVLCLFGGRSTSGIDGTILIGGDVETNSSTLARSSVRINTGDMPDGSNTASKIDVFTPVINSSGSIEIETGDSNNGDVGNISFLTGQTNSGGTGSGDITIITGSSAEAAVSSGDITISTGSNSADPTNVGTILLDSAGDIKIGDSSGYTIVMPAQSDTPSLNDGLYVSSISGSDIRMSWTNAINIPSYMNIILNSNQTSVNQSTIVQFANDVGSVGSDIVLDELNYRITLTPNNNYMMTVNFVAKSFSSTSVECEFTFTAVTIPLNANIKATLSNVTGTQSCNSMQLCYTPTNTNPIDITCITDPGETCTILANSSWIITKI